MLRVGVKFGRASHIAKLGWKERLCFILPSWLDRPALGGAGRARDVH